MTDDITVNGQGMIRLSRSSRGICVKMRLHPGFEEFAKSLGDGSVMPVDLHGKEWVAAPNEPPLLIYDLTNTTVRGQYFGMANAGQKLEVAPGIANLSFLRVQGASQREVTFWVQEPKNKRSLLALQNTVTMGLAEIAEDYMRELELEIQFTFRPKG